MSPLANRVLIAVPCLNEARHIGRLLEELHASADRLGALIVVVDGGSTDDTIQIVTGLMGRLPGIEIVHNAMKIQSAAVNLAVERYGTGCEYLIRIDAHGSYPADYCDRLIEDAERMNASSVVVPMLTSGEGTVQGAVAAVQNSVLGTGGAKHRERSAGEWVDHGHHALFRIAAFRAVGGYDDSFSHNEDAELDVRLGKAGHRIWLTGNTHMIYYPRATLGALFRQYLAFGRGRARNVLKHRTLPKIRQMVPLAVAPSLALLPFAFAHWIFAIPALLWAAMALIFGGVVTARSGKPRMWLVGICAMVIHFAWSLGFWLQLFATVLSSQAPRTVSADGRA